MVWAWNRRSFGSVYSCWQLRHNGKDSKVVRWRSKGAERWIEYLGPHRVQLIMG
jgi:hypothetical protein